MKVGDYVRTRHYGIFKILNIEKDGKTIFLKKAQGIDVVVADKNNKIEDEIININSTAIELLEVGDYVNGYYVTTGNQGVGSIYIAEIDGLGLKKKLYEKDIKSIVTREMFESMKYKVGD